MQYFTIWHYLIMMLFFALYVAAMVVGVKRFKQIKMLIFIAISGVILTMLLGYSAMILVDRSTKTAQIIALNQTMVLLNESLMFNGAVKNTGKYHITACELEMNLVSPPAAISRIDKSGFDRGFFDIFLGKGNTSTRSQTFKIASHIKPGQTRQFSFSMPHSANQGAPSIHYVLSCR